MRGLLGVAGLVAAVLAVLALPVAWGLDRVFGEDVILVQPADEATLALERQDWKDGGDDRSVAELYGRLWPGDATTRVLFAKGRVIHPKERASLSILVVDKGKADNPFQAKTLWFAARWTAIGAAVAAVLAFLVRALLFRKRSHAVASA